MGVAAEKAEAGVAMLRRPSGDERSGAAGRSEAFVESERVACRRVRNRLLSMKRGKSNVENRIGKNKETECDSSPHAD